MCEMVDDVLRCVYLCVGDGDVVVWCDFWWNVDFMLLIEGYDVDVWCVCVEFVVCY